MSDWSWDFVLNLSETAFPVKPVSKLAEFLGKHRNKNFIRSDDRVTYAVRNNRGKMVEKTRH